MEKKWIAVGFALALIFGIGLHNYAVGIAIGLATGVAIAVFGARSRGG